MTDSQKLIVPVYLNQRVLFDLVAMLQGGISTVSSIKRSEDNSKSAEEKAKASFGLSDAFSTLLKIDLSGERSTKNTDQAKTESSEERVHTPASLFYTLRNLLQTKGHLRSVSAGQIPMAGDIVEIPLALKRNPVLETVEMLLPLMQIAKAFDEESTKQAKKASQNSEYQQIEKQINVLIGNLRSGGTVDLVGRSAAANLNVVVTAEVDFLRDQMMSDIVDGQFTVVGKVIRRIDNASESIDLLRKSSIAKMPAIADKFLSALGTLGEAHGISIPELTPTIQGPVVQVLPIAIYA